MNRTPGAHRSGRETLASSGYYCSAVGSPKRLRLIQCFLPILVDQSIKLNNVTPSLQHHYKAFDTTTHDPPLCLASVLRPSQVLCLSGFPLHRDERFPRSTQKPVLSSRLLHAGCRLGNKQVPPRSSRVTLSPSILTSSLRFRHVIKGSLAFVSLTLT